MGVLIPRRRTIGVRLTHEEFAALERFCLANGARSISDLARSAICGLLNSTSRDGALASTVNEYSEQVKGLEQKVERLTAEIASLKGLKRSRRAQ